MPGCSGVRPTARMAGFMPPASPPLVSTAMLEGPVAEAAGAVSVMTKQTGQDVSAHQSYPAGSIRMPHGGAGGSGRSWRQPPLQTPGLHDARVAEVRGE